MHLKYLLLVIAFFIFTVETDGGIIINEREVNKRSADPHHKGYGGYETYNNNNGYELDIQPEDEKKSGDKGSDDMEGVENINVLDVEDIDILEDEDLYNDDDHVEEDKLELKKGMTFEIWKIAETYLENFAKQQGFSFRKRRREID
ncbi:hypothetical protein RhiirA4_449433, partial [Rhizophagus irregularis]